MELALSAPVLALPEVACAPLHAPVAVQPVALVELHVRVAEAPLAMAAGVAVRLTVGAGLVPTCRTSMALTQASPVMRVNTRFRVASVVTVKV